MSPTQARAFHAVAMAGSFTAASKILNVSQPTMTTQVKELEALYGVELFHRHPRGVVLTDTGHEQTFSKRLTIPRGTMTTFLNLLNTF